jgi:hypothetical protein
MTPRKTSKSKKRSAHHTGMYLCYACGKVIERQAEDNKPLKKWRKSFCESTSKNVRIWLKLEHNMPPDMAVH